VGKTTTLQALQRLRPDWVVRAEPVKEWEALDVGVGKPVNLLNAFYERKDRESFRQLQVRRSSRRFRALLICQISLQRSTPLESVT
jgi:hypothetical protein